VVCRARHLSSCGAVPQRRDVLSVSKVLTSDITTAAARSEQSVRLLAVL
jgi:hypothetical protein